MAFLQKSLIARLIFYFLLLSLVPIALVGLLSFAQARQALRTAIIEQAIANVANKEESLDRWQLAREQDLTFLALSTEMPQMIGTLIAPEATNESDYQANQTRLNRYVAETLVLKPDLAEIFILSLTGDVIYSSNDASVGQNYESDFFFRQGRINTTLQKMYTSPLTGEPTMTIGAPVLDENSQRIAVLAAHLDMERLDEIVIEEDSANGTQSYIIAPSNRLIVSSKRLETNSIDPTITIDSQGIGNALSGIDGANVYKNHNGIMVFGAYRWIDNLDVALLTETPQEAASQPTSRLAFSILIIGLIATLILIVVSRLLTNQIANPILNLTETAVEVSGGDLSVTATVFTEDEIGTLARTFNQMTEQLRRVYQSLETQVNVRTAELARSVDQLALINEVGQNANAELQMQTLLPAVTNLIRQRLNYYTVNILLIDQAEQRIYLSAAASLENIQPLLDEPGIPLNGEVASIIVEAIHTRQPLIVSDVHQEPLYLASKYLPRTESELALPLLVADEVLGVLDLQSDRLNDFGPEDVRVLQTLADQIAVAIQNATLYQEAEGARAEAEEANRLKTQFLANMSHELRTPLNAVINFAYILSVGMQGELNEEQKDMVERIGSAGHHLLNLINDILDLAKIESGRLDLYLEDVSLYEIVHSVLSTATGLVRGKDVELIQAVSTDTPLIRADHGRIRQVLLNLVSNAAKFTKSGDITVCAEPSEEMMIVSVKDTGIGMAPEDIPKAFAEFVQVDGNLKRQAGGTGLGLPISKRFVEMHGGEMWVESVVGKGTTFFFTLPLAKDDDE